MQAILNHYQAGRTLFMVKESNKSYLVRQSKATK